MMNRNTFRVLIILGIAAVVFAVVGVLHFAELFDLSMVRFLLSPNGILYSIPVIGSIGVFLMSIVWYRFYVKVQARGEVTDEERKRVILRSVIPSAFYGLALSFCWLLVELTSSAPTPLWRRFASSLPCFGVGIAGGLLMTVRMIATLKQQMRGHGPWKRYR